MAMYDDLNAIYPNVYGGSAPETNDGAYIDDLSNLVDLTGVVPLNAPKMEYIPAGRYVLSIVSGEVRTAKGSEKQFLRLCFKVMNGKYKGHTFGQAFFIMDGKDNSPHKKLFATLREACGLQEDEPGRISDLHKKKVLADVSVKEKKHSPDGEKCNRADNFFPYGEEEPSVPSQPMQPSQPVPPSPKFCSASLKKLEQELMRTLKNQGNSPF